MVHFSLLVTLCFCCLLGFSFGSFSVPSFGRQPAEAIRSKLQDRDFHIQFKRAVQVKTPTFQASFADLTKFPSLAAQDVQSTIIIVNLKAGEPLFTHFHPRGSETIYVLKGTFRASFRFEGIGDTRIISNVIKTGDATVFPQGLIHDTVCISKRDCAFLAVLNSADPGTIAV